jgi:hypothetical protein
LSQSDTGEAVFDRILRNELSKATRSSALLYVVNAMGYLVVGRALLFFFPSSISSPEETVLDAYVGAIAAYAVIIYLVTRSQKRVGLAAHFYSLGILGLTGVGVLFAFGSIGFLSGGYWLGQSRRAGDMKCIRDNGHVAVFGQDSLVCTRCSRLVKIGLDLPRRWFYTGIGLVLIGLVLYFFASAMPSFSNLLYAVLNIPFVLVLDGMILVLEPLYVQRVIFGGGYVRLPPDTRGLGST